MRHVLGFILVVAMFLLSAGVALGHGGEDEALEKTPSRALAQQALAYLSQENKAGEARERIEAALKSEDSEGVDIALLRRAQRALERGDQAAATRLIGQALAPADEDGAREDGAMGGGHEEEAGTGGSVDVNPAALEHSPEFEPDRGTAEWVAVGLGAAAILLGTALLLRLRRRPA